MQTEESYICDGIFEESVIVRLVNKSTVVESGIRDVFIYSRDILCIFNSGQG